MAWWQGLVTWLARPLVRAGFAFLLTTLLSSALTTSILAAWDQLWPRVWPVVWQALRWLLRKLVALALSALFVALFYDFVLRQDQLLDELTAGALAMAFNAGQGMHGAVCSWPRIPRAFCPDDRSVTATGDAAPIVIVVQTAPAPDPYDSRIIR